MQGSQTPQNANALKRKSPKISRMSEPSLLNGRRTGDVKISTQAGTDLCGKCKCKTKESRNPETPGHET